MADWYKTHGASPDCYPESEYREWAGLYVDLAGNVDYGPPEPAREFQRSMENAQDRDWLVCSDPPGLSCSDALCSVHGWDDRDWGDAADEDDGDA